MRERGKLVSPAFVLVTASALAYFVGLGVLAPVLPRFVEDELGGNDLAVGLAVGAFAISAALLRPAVGRIGDARGRRVLVLGGAAIASLSILGYEAASSLPVLVGLRLVTGIGEAAVFVGAATAVQDMAPPDRRGEAASYFSVAVYVGLAAGPIVGDLTRSHYGFAWTWLVAAGACAVAAVLAFQIPPSADRRGEVASGPRRLLHPAAIRPGLVLACSTTGYAGFAAFVPLYVKDVGISGSGAVFAEYAVAVLLVRVVAPWLPDRLGSVRGGSIALVLQAVGFAVMAGSGNAVGLYVGTGIYSLGVSVLYPALFPMVVGAAPEAERSQAIATFTLFFDVSQGLGAFALGAVVALGGDRTSFAVSAVLALVGFALLRHPSTRALELPAFAPGPAEGGLEVS